MEITRLTSDSVLRDMTSNAHIAGCTCRCLKVNDFDHIAYLKKIIKKGHESVLEHINLTFHCKDFSRAMLQELARHRHISLSVESTRHAMHKRLMDVDNTSEAMEEALEYAVTQLTDTMGITKDSSKAKEAANSLLDIVDPVFNDLDVLLSDLGSIAQAMPKDHTLIKSFNDLLKYFLPDVFPTSCIMTLNLRELRHILKLRTHPAALYEFRLFCGCLYAELPDWFKPLVDDCMDKELMEAVKESESEENAEGTDE